MKNKRPAMGRGLSALLDSSETEPNPVKNIPEKLSPTNFALIPLEFISANPFQPRTVFEEEALMELVQSIRQQGIIQPVTVRKAGDSKYQLISGGRRFKAAGLAGLTEIPAYIRSADDKQMLEMALVENIQRQDLDPVEIAISFQRLIEECSLTHDALSRNVGKDRTTITNYLRLLKLPAEIQIALRNAKISMGHGRALIAIDEQALQLKIFKDIIKYDLSVRQVEEKVRHAGSAVKREKKSELLTTNNHLSKSLSEYLKTRVELKRGIKGNGSIIIKFSSEEELRNIVNMINNKIN